MKTPLYLLLILLLEIFTSFTTLPDQDITAFRSSLRPGKIDWNITDVYSDTLELVKFNTDYDYSFAVFRTKTGKEVSLYTQEEVDHYYRNRNFIVQWKIGKYYEAGEGDVVYYHEELVSYQRLTNSYSLNQTLQAFAEQYRTNNMEDIQQYIHPEVGLLTAYNPGAYCVLMGRDENYEMTYLGREYNVASTHPTGGFCEGYPDTKDGLYYEFIDELGLPTYADMVNEGEPKGLYIEPHIDYWYFAKVIMITEEYHNRVLYFFNGDDRWYFWVEDFCDCSA